VRYVCLPLGANIKVPLASARSLISAISVAIFIYLSVSSFWFWIVFGLVVIYTLDLLPTSNIFISLSLYLSFNTGTASSTVFVLVAYNIFSVLVILSLFKDKSSEIALEELASGNSSK